MTEILVKYGDHVAAAPGTPCEVCENLPPRPFADHCHEHGWVRGTLCPRCNQLMALIDRGVAPPAEMIPRLIEFARRCPECPALIGDDLLCLEDRVTFLAKLPPELHRWLKIAAAERGVNMNDILVASLDSARMRLGSWPPERHPPGADAGPNHGEAAYLDDEIGGMT